MPTTIDGANGVNNVALGTVLPNELSVGGPTWDSAGNVVLGTGTGNGHTINGTLTATGNIIAGSPNGSIFGAASIELAAATAVDVTSFIDFHARAGSDFDARLIRNQGINGSLDIVQTGTGAITVQSPSGNFNLLDFNMKLLSSNGYQEFPGGLLVQWVNVAAGFAQTTTGSWPIVFTTYLGGVASFNSVANAATNTHIGVSGTNNQYTITRGADNANAATILAWGIA